jgi:hypothetical protein
LFDTRAITATKVVRLERLVADQAAVGPAEPPALSSNQPVGFELLAVLETETFTTVTVGIARSIPTWPNRTAPPRTPITTTSGCGLLHSSVRHGKFGLASLGLTVAGGRLTLPSASKRLVQLDHGGELVPRDRGEVQLRAEELALGVEDVELGGEPTLVAESGQ